MANESLTNDKQMQRRHLDRVMAMPMRDLIIECSRLYALALGVASALESVHPKTAEKIRNELDSAEVWNGTAPLPALDVSPPDRHHLGTTVEEREGK